MPDVKPDIVAVVCQDEAVRESLQFLLEAGEYRVEAFATAADFLNENHQHIACLLLDQEMPAMTGLELAQYLKLTGVAIPIVLMIGAKTPDIAGRAVALGIVSVLEKPMDGHDLLAIVEVAMIAH